MKVLTNRGNLDIIIIIFYNPCGNLTQDMLEEVGGPLQDSAIWYGDFNLDNSLWGRNRTGVNGSVIRECIDEHCLVCINNWKVHNTISHTMQN